MTDVERLIAVGALAVFDNTWRDPVRRAGVSPELVDEAAALVAVNTAASVAVRQLVAEAWKSGFVSGAAQ